ncbi:hypothetical protein SKAU_G00083270 [Synaphobranchus kaupii]|uniref:Uncharacterized protein n=1 Tax=Synaphobranchus kaupii TaxID=118154 RepID=A0A9Q1J5E6_SYNKA|nr:hypothetical protein SKAU_G00083270 [Synaphobranchus kaupii]
MGSEREEEWCPPLPERTYLIDGTLEDIRGGGSSPATFLQPPVDGHAHTPPPVRRGGGSGGTPRPQHFDTSQLTRRGPCIPVRRATSPQPSAHPNLTPTCQPIAPLRSAHHTTPATAKMSARGQH